MIPERKKIHRTIAMPEVVTHRYDPSVGACLNVCSLPDAEALWILDRLRRKSRPNLKPDYLARRRTTEKWLTDAATQVLKRTPTHPPAYFFLGDFSYLHDASRPASLVVPLSRLPSDAITFTLGDSMTVAEQPERRLYKLDEIMSFSAAGDVSEFGLSDKSGFQKRFIEVQLWEGSTLLRSN